MAKSAERRRASVPWTGLLLYLAMVFLSTVAVVVADWADHVALLPLVGFLGALAGAVLAHSLFKRRTAFWMSAAYGLFITSFLLSETLDPALAWRERLLFLWIRFGEFLQVVARGQENQDPLMVVLLMCLLYWAMAVYGAWSLFRTRQVWGAVLPLGAALFLNALYYVGRARIDLLLAIFLLFALLLLLFRQLDDRQSVWRRIYTRVPSRAVESVARAGALVALSLVLLAWAGPAFAQSEGAAAVWHTVSGPWRAVRERLGDVVAGLNAPVQLVSDQFAGDLELDAGVRPAEAYVMEVRPVDRLQGPGRFYWRARTFGHYERGAWSTDLATDLRFDPEEDELALNEHAGREEVELVFAIENAVQRTLYLPTEPLWVSRTSDLQVVRNEGEIVDVTALRSLHPIHPGETYRARTLIAVPTAEELRLAGEAYPDWVTQRYLQLPESITPRTAELARRIAGDLPTAYDKAEAITAWLRTNIEYQRVTPAPPRDVEPLDWFLFEYSTGFCNYYAAAEVVMLRSLGVPARLAVGYASGEFFPERGVYEVWAEDYHAWPEVFFPGYGWVEFEPTVSEPALIRPEPEGPDEFGGEEPRAGIGSPGESDDLRLDQLEDLFDEGGVEGNQVPLVDAVRSNPSLFISLVAAVVALTVLVWTRLDVAWRRTLAGAGAWLSKRTGWEVPARIERWGGRASPAELAYRRWVRWLPRLGLAIDRQQTPNERVATFSGAYPELAESARRLVGSYTRERFAADDGDSGDIRQLWPRLERRLLIAWLGRLARRLQALIQREPDPKEAEPQPWSLELQ